MSDGVYLEEIILGGQKLTIRDPSASRDITLESIINKIYPVNSVILRYDNEDPNIYLGVGEWEKITDNHYLRSGAIAGQSGGSNQLSLTIENLPAHSHVVEENGTHAHSATIAESGSHSHEGTAHTSGSHNHNLKGYDGIGASGNSGIKLGGNGTDQSTAICINAGEHSHTLSINESGTHSHSATISDSGIHVHNIQETGSGDPINIEPMYTTLVVWKRIS